MNDYKANPLPESELKLHPGRLIYGLPGEPPVFHLTKKGKSMPESELEQILDRLYANAHWLNDRPVPYKADELLTISEAKRQIKLLLAQEYARGKQDGEAIKKLKEQE